MAQNPAVNAKDSWRTSVSTFLASIGTKIIVPYLLLTLFVAGIGAYIVTNLVTSTLQERFNNQLLDSGRVVAESMVEYERERLELLRIIAFSEDVPNSLISADSQLLANTIPQIAANTTLDTVAMVDKQGFEIYSWDRSSTTEEQLNRGGRDFSQLEDVRLVLQGFADEIGDKRTVLSQTSEGYVLFTVGPVRQEENIVGAVLVGTSVRKMVVGLTENAIARVTLYDREGNVIDTTLGLDPQSETDILQESPELYETIIQRLQESPDQYRVVRTTAESQVRSAEIEILNQGYQLAYGDWRVRDNSFGLFSVALPSTFIINTAVTSRTQLSIVFSVATMAVMAIGYFIAQRITIPLSSLVQTSRAIAQGKLGQRTGIKRQDEIGTLANSFDIMTAHLEEQNLQLAKQASELEAILQSIADAVIVFDINDQIVATNPAARQILPHLLEENGKQAGESIANGEIDREALLALDQSGGKQRFEIGNRVFSALSAPVATADRDRTGQVIVLRDITREAEVEQLKDGFITSVSHELRTPLTSIKGFIDLLVVSAADKLGSQQVQFAQVVSENTDQMIDHVNKLIDIAEIQRGTLQLRKQWEPLARLVRETVESWEERMESKKLTLDLQLVEDNIWVYVDTVRLVWAIDNLLENAHDYTPTGGRVSVRAYQEGDEVHISVADTGIGISSADQPYLFSRFYRIQNEHTFHIPGLGLDLFITRSIVEAHEGRVWVESELGQGSTFNVALPLSQPPDDLTLE